MNKYTCKASDLLDEGASIAYSSREEAFDSAFRENENLPRGSLVSIHEHSFGKFTETIVYHTTLNEIYTMTRGIKKTISTKVDFFNNKGLDVDIKVLNHACRENSLRVATIRSLLAIEATQRKEPHPIGEPEEFNPTSKFTSDLKPSLYHQIVKGDIIDTDNANERLASWIHNLVEITGYTGSIVDLARLKKFSKTNYEPAITFPVDLSTLEIFKRG